MNQYYVWPDYVNRTLNVAKIVYENQSYYVARRNGSSQLLCIRRKNLPHAIDSAQRPEETANGLGWKADWQLHLDASVVKGKKELEACRKEWGVKMKLVAYEDATRRVSAAKAQIAELEQQLREQRCLLQKANDSLSCQLGLLDDREMSVRWGNVCNKEVSE